ncbi:MAG: hypothetical protein GXZ14_03470 [Ruminococcaceae bacterium]|nr:hypothetical protein [Oscillospiraceae bacterium]
MGDIISDDVDYENQVINKITMKLLRDSLYQWKPWANEILDLYLDGKDECITRFLCDKLECSEQYSRRLKKEFASIVEKYLKNQFRF